MDLQSLRVQFQQLFGGRGEPNVVAAPGRVNLIGEHTDYNDGLVCPIAIDKSTVIVCRLRTDGGVRMYSNIVQESVEFPIDHPVPKKGPTWALYAKGVAETLRQKGLLAHGIDALVDSDVPLGGGLSSSASFEIATGLALLSANKSTLDMESLTVAGHWAEHHYAGVPCGIMDQYICAMAQAGHAMLLDCRDRSVRHVPLADPHVRIVIANSNVKHALIDGGYAARRSQCQAAVTYLQKKHKVVQALRDVTTKILDAAKAGMEPVVYKRAKHVITEIQRTVDFANALEAKDYVKCGELMHASHLSLRDDYEVSCPELDTLEAIADSVPGVFGARMTGGGFGGCIVALVKADAVAPLTATLHRDYQKAYGEDTTVFSTMPSAGAHVVK